MYICECCENTFEEPKTIEEPHPYGMGYATEKWAVCPHCESTNFDEAVKCERCGEYAAELDGGLCDVCYGDMYGE